MVLHAAQPRRGAPPPHCVHWGPTAAVSSAAATPAAAGLTCGSDSILMMMIFLFFHWEVPMGRCHLLTRCLGTRRLLQSMPTFQLCRGELGAGKERGSIRVALSRARSTCSKLKPCLGPWVSSPMLSTSRNPWGQERLIGKARALQIKHLNIPRGSFRGASPSQGTPCTLRSLWAMGGGAAPSTHMAVKRGGGGGRRKRKAKDDLCFSCTGVRFFTRFDADVSFSTLHVFLYFFFVLFCFFFLIK